MTSTTLNSSSNMSPFHDWIETATHRAHWCGGYWEIFARQGQAFVLYAVVGGWLCDSLADLLARVERCEDDD